MAYVVRSRGDRWEVRESVHTERGPRSRTLATFDALTPQVTEAAVAKSSRGITPHDVEQAARRAGAPIASPPADQAARELIAELMRGAKPRPILARLIVELAGSAGEAISDAARSAAQWAYATPADKADTLRDLLLLADALPEPKVARTERFPRIQSAT